MATPAVRRARSLQGMEAVKALGVRRLTLSSNETNRPPNGLGVAVNATMVQRGPCTLPTLS